VEKESRAVRGRGSRGKVGLKGPLNLTYILSHARGPLRTIRIYGMICLLLGGDNPFKQEKGLPSGRGEKEARGWEDHFLEYNLIAGG